MEQVKVWDLFVRVAHWLLGLLVVSAFVTSDSDRLVSTHVTVGLGILAIVLTRVSWGFVGPKPARFRTFVRSPREVLAYAKATLGKKPPLHLSHNPLGGVMVVALLLMLIGLGVSGILVFASASFRGPLAELVGRGLAHDIKEVHEGLASGLLVLIGLHVAGVLFSSWREGQNLVLGMITGRKLNPPDEPLAPTQARTPLRLGAVLMVGIAIAVALSFWLGVPALANAVPPSGVAHGHDENRESRKHGRHGESRKDRKANTERPQLRTNDPETRALYAQECAACHFDFPPPFLPASEHRRVLANLAQHFGESVELEPGDRARLESWLVANAAPEPSTARPSTEAPRISNLPWFTREHRKVARLVGEGGSVKTFATCDACHLTAKDWNFSEDSVKVPGR